MYSFYQNKKGDNVSSSIEYKSFILEQLRSLDNIKCRPMMGEYILYYNDLIFGGIYDDRLLVKKVSNNEKYNMPEIIPYKNAKPMFFVEDVDNIMTLKDIILDTYEGLKNL